LTAKPTRNEPLGRPRNRWEDDIKMGPKETGFEAVDWINPSKAELNIPSAICWHY